MLKQRILTALVLLALLVPALWAQVVWPFAVLTLILVAVGGWEWARLNGVSNTVGAYGFGLVVGVVGLALWLTGHWNSLPAAYWYGLGLFWVLGVGLILWRGVPAWPALWQPVRVVGGGVLLCSAWLALALSKAQGLNFILSVFCLVWMADIAAYVSGRTWGRRKLALSISPGKSWEGAYGAWVATLVMTWVWCWVEQRMGASSLSLFGHIKAAWGGLGLSLTVMGLCAMSIVGDLFESLVKRSSGAKDSSAVLPGHGGVLDRIDALLPVFPLAWVLLLLTR